MTTRRGFITGLVSLVATPSIVKVESLMKLPKPRLPKFQPQFFVSEYYNNRVIRIPVATWRAMNVADFINPFLDMPLITISDEIKQ